MERSIAVQLIGDVVSSVTFVAYIQIDIEFIDCCLCPQFHLAEPKDEIIRSKTNQVNHNDTNMMCKFGNLELNIGDKIKDRYCVDCSCAYPPMAHCIQSGHC